MIPLPTNDEKPIATMRSVDFSYEVGTPVLQGITLDLWRGEHIALVGGNGSGKTTLAKHLNGLLKPTRGHVVVGGLETSKEPVSKLAKTVGYVFQNPDHQLFCPTVTEEVQFGPRNLGFSDSEIAQKTRHALELLTLDNVKMEAPMSLSLGDRRRVSIASVVATDPDVLVLDEPFTGLDSKEAKELMQVVKGINREGKTIILITHDMRVVAEHSERVILLTKGRLILDCRTEMAFSELNLLSDSGLTPPPAIKLAHRLFEYGVSTEVLTADELAEEISRLLGGVG